MKTITIQVNDKMAAAIEGIIAGNVTYGHKRERIKMNILKRGIEDIIYTTTGDEEMKLYVEKMKEAGFHGDLVNMWKYLQKTNG